MSNRLPGCGLTQEELATGPDAQRERPDSGYSAISFASTPLVQPKPACNEYSPPAPPAQHRCSTLYFSTSAPMAAKPWTLLLNPAIRDLAGKIVLSVGVQAFDGQILKRRPAIGPVPLLSGRRRGRAEAAGLEEPLSQRSRHRMGLIRRRETEIQRKHRRRREDVALTPVLPKIVGEESRLRVPHQAPDRGAPVIRERHVAFGVVLIAFQPIGLRQRLFEMHHQCIEIDRRDRRRANRPEIRAVGKPAGRKIPAALCAGAQIPVDVFSGPVRTPRRFDVLTIGFVAGSGAIVPITIEQRPIRKADARDGEPSRPQGRPRPPSSSHIRP